MTDLNQTSAGHAPLESALGRDNALGWGRSLARCESILPLADGRFLVVHGTSGTYDPDSDIYETAAAAGAAVISRLTKRGVA